MFGYGFTKDGPWFTENGNGEPFKDGQSCLEFAKAQVFFAAMDAQEKKEARVWVVQIEPVQIGVFAMELCEGFVGDLKERIIAQINDEGAEEVITAMDTAFATNEDASLDLAGNIRDLVNWWADRYEVPTCNRVTEIKSFGEDDPWRQ